MAADPSGEQDTRTRTQLLEAVAQGWLLFHCGDWGPEQEVAWAQLGLGEACTSKALGDATRRALAMPIPEPAAEERAVLLRYAQRALARWRTDFQFNETPGDVLEALIDGVQQGAHWSPR